MYCSYKIATGIYSRPKFKICTMIPRFSHGSHPWFLAFPFFVLCSPLPDDFWHSVPRFFSLLAYFPASWCTSLVDVHCLSLIYSCHVFIDKLTLCAALAHIALVLTDRTCQLLTWLACWPFPTPMCCLYHMHVHLHQTSFLCAYMGILLHSLSNHWISHTWLFLVNAMRWELICNLGADDVDTWSLLTGPLTGRRDML